MKRIIITWFFATFTGALVNAQLDTSTASSVKPEAEQLLRVSKKQNTTGWVLLSTGIALAGVSFLIHPFDSDFTTGFELIGLKTVLLVGGAGLTIASIPVLIISGIKKKKARIMLNAQQVKITPQLRTNTWQWRTGIAVNF